MKKNIIITHPKTGSTYLAHVLDCLIEDKTKLIIKRRSTLEKRQYLLSDNLINFFYYPRKEHVEKYEQKILFVRDVRDLLVSQYFHLKYKSKNRKLPKGKEDIDEYCLYDIAHVIEALFLKYNNVFTHLLRYETINTDTIYELLNVMRVDIDYEDVSKCLEYYSFENMKKLEISGKSEELQGIDVNNNETFKVRRGKIHGYKDYLKKETINELNRVIDSYQNITKVPITYQIT